MNKPISPKIVALTFGVLVVVFAVAFYVVAWTEPTEAPPEGNVPTPINTGPEPQTKEGSLKLGGYFVSMKDMIGQETIFENGPVNISTSFSDSCCPFDRTENENYSFSVYNPKFLYTLPGDDCQTSLGSKALGGIYEGTGPPGFKFFYVCQDPKLRLLETLTLRDRGKVFSASGRQVTGVLTGDNWARVRSFWTDFPGDINENIYLPETAQSCDAKITVCTIGGQLTGRYYNVQFSQGCNY